MKFKKYMTDYLEPLSFNTEKDTRKKVLELVCPRCKKVLDTIYEYEEVVNKQQLVKEYIEKRGQVDFENKNVMDTVIHMCSTVRKNLQRGLLGKIIEETYRIHTC